MTEPHDHPERETRDIPVRRNGLILAITVFAIWMLATYLFEGRTRLLDIPGVQDQLIYVVAANMLVGIGMVVASLFFLTQAGFLQLFRLGLRRPLRSGIAAVLAALAGFTVYFTQVAAVTFPGTVFLFAAVLPIAVAEVLVCWALLGAGVESADEAGSRPRAMALGLVAAAVAYGFSHLAHSPPFNEWATILFFMLPGIATGLVFFLIRDLYATIVFHTFLGMAGLSVGRRFAAGLEPEYPVYIVALVAIGLVLSAHAWLHRKSGEPVG